MYPITAGIVVAARELEEELLHCLHELPVRIVFELSEIPGHWPEFLDRIARTKPDVILLDVTDLREPLEEVLRQIGAAASHPAVFALHTKEDSAKILAALRGGASEYLYPPFAERLKAAFERLAQVRLAARSASAREGKTVAFLSAKGGCGATTVACHVAVDLPRQTQAKVLLADLDFESGLIGFLLKTKSSYSVADAARNLQRLDQSYWHGLVSNGITGVEIITAPTTPAARQVAKDQLAQVLAFARTQYDWTILDLGRGLTPTTLSVLDQIDDLYLVTTDEIPALHQAKEMIQNLLDSGCDREKLHLLINRMPKHSDVTLDEMGHMLGLPVLATIPNDYGALEAVYSQGRLLDPASALGKSFHHLTARIAGVQEQKKKFSLFG